MARITDIRASIRAAEPTQEVEELPVEPSDVPEHDYEESEFIRGLCKHCGQEASEHEESYDDEDLCTALDLMETSYQMIKYILDAVQLGITHRQLLQNHCDDLKQFLDQFPELGLPNAGEADEPGRDA